MNEQTRKALELARDGLKDLWKPLFGSLYIDGSRPAVVMAIQKALATIDAVLSAPAAPVAQPLTGSAAHIKTAMSKLEAAMNCHPNAVQSLISEAWDELNEAHGIGQGAGNA